MGFDIYCLPWEENWTTNDKYDFFFIFFYFIRTERCSVTQLIRLGRELTQNRLFFFFFPFLQENSDYFYLFFLLNFSYQPWEFKQEIRLRFSRSSEVQDCSIQNVSSLHMDISCSQRENSATEKVTSGCYE